jgi:hypothetical protein
MATDKITPWSIKWFTIYYYTWEYSL